MEKIHIFMTGGTIDSFYNGIKDTAMPRKKSIIPKYIKFLQLHQNFRFSEICMKDSRDIGEPERRKILLALESSKENKIIITHGTYTMPDTAKWLEAKLKRKDLIVVLTGGMIPLEGFSPSDCPFNLGYAISEIKYLKPGIYILMNGKKYKPQEVVKDLKTGKFATIYDHEWYS